MTTIRTRLAALAAAGAVAAIGLAVDSTAADATTRAPSQCTNSSLAVTRTYDHGGQSMFMRLIYRNKSRQACTITGYPGLDAIDEFGHVIGHAKRVRGTAPLRTITVAPGDFASAAVVWRNGASHHGRCDYSSAINTIAPNTSKVHRFPVSVDPCRLQVHPTVAGTPGYPGYAPAQRDWIEGAHVDSATAPEYWRAAARALPSGHGDGLLAHELRHLANMPDTGLTHKQRVTQHRLVIAIDMSFATPRLYH